jgi:hypothetical protein
MRGARKSNDLVFVVLWTVVCIAVLAAATVAAVYI